MPVKIDTMTPGNPASEAYARLMHGAALTDATRLTAEEEQRGQQEFSRIWERLLHNAEVTKWLAPGQDLGWRGGAPLRVLRAKGGGTTDLVRLIPWVLREKLAGDVFYEDVHRREEQVVLARGLEPGDAASIRYRSTNPATADGQPLQGVFLNFRSVGAVKRPLDQFSLGLRMSLAMARCFAAARWWFSAMVGSAAASSSQTSAIATWTSAHRCRAVTWPSVPMASNDAVYAVVLSWRSSSRRR